MSTTIYDGTFNGPTSAGSAGSTTGAADTAAIGTANAWDDQLGGIWYVNSSNLLTRNTSSTYLTNWLTRPTGEAVQDESISFYFQYESATTTTVSALLRVNSNNAYWYTFETNNSSVTFYPIVAGALGSGFSGSTGITLTNTHHYKLTLRAIGVSPTSIQLSLYDLDSASPTVSIFGSGFNDSTSALQTTGTCGLNGWDTFGGPATTQFSRLVIVHETLSMSLSPTTGLTLVPETITVHGVNTSWVSGTTTFSASSGTISGLAINNITQVATFTFTPGSSPGTVTISNSRDGLTAPITVSASAQFTVSPSLSTTGQTYVLTITGNGLTSWVNGTTHFSVSGGSGTPTLTSQSINNSTQVATATLYTGTGTGTLVISDSTDSATANVTIDALSTLVMGALSNGSPSPSGITVEWSAVTSGSITGISYALYRYASAPFTPPGTGTLVGTTTGTSILDTSPGADDVFYRVIATDAQPETSLSIQTAYQVALPARIGLAPWNFGFVGDSITYGGAGNYTVSMLQPLEPNRVITMASNQAVSGTYSNQWLPPPAGGSYFSGALAAFQAAGVTHIMIMLGTNDAWTVVMNTVAAYQANMQAIANAFVAQGFIVILNAPPFTVPGSGDNTRTEPGTTLLVGYRDALKAICNGTTILLGDTNSFDYFLQNPSLLVDGIHPTVTGTTPLGSQSLGNLWGSAFLKAVYVAFSISYYAIGRIFVSVP